MAPLLLIRNSASLPQATCVKIIILICTCGKSGPLSKKGGQEVFFCRIGQVSCVGEAKRCREFWEEDEE